MRFKTERNTFLRGEDNVVDESLWIVKEHQLFSFALEVIEYVFVENAVLWIVGSLDQVFGVLPGYWAIVSELRECLLKELTITVDVGELTGCFDTSRFGCAMAVSL
jgi:hypothetical protein